MQLKWQEAKGRTRHNRVLLITGIDSIMQTAMCALCQWRHRDLGTKFWYLVQG